MRLAKLLICLVLIPALLVIGFGRCAYDLWRLRAPR